MQFVEAKYRHDGVDISAKLLASVHLAEIFSPSRFAEKGETLGAQTWRGG